MYINGIDYLLPSNISLLDKVIILKRTLKQTVQHFPFYFYDFLQHLRLLAISFNRNV